MKTIDLNNENFTKEVLNSNSVVMVDFWADWCGPCRMLSPIIEEVSDEMPDMKVGKVNIDDSPELSAVYNVMSVPTVLFFKNGKVVNQSIGVKSKDQLLATAKKSV